MKWTVGIVCGTALMAGAAFAGGSIDGTGTVGTCPVSGSIKIKPGLVFGGTDPIATKAKAATTGACSGGTLDGATVVSFKAKGAGTGAANDCASLAVEGPSDLTLTVKYKVTSGSPKLNASTVTFTTQAGGVSGSQPYVDLIGSVTAGSFLGTPVTAHIATDETTTDLATLCGAKGVKKISFGLAVGTTSTTTL